MILYSEDLNGQNSINFYMNFFSLGCGIGYGYLHRIPKRQFPSSVDISSPTAAPIPQKSQDGFAEVRRS